MRCGVEGSQVSDGGLACFHFRLSDFGWVFFQCSRITNCFVTRMWFSVFFLLLDFWNKSSFLNVLFNVNLVTVLDNFHIPVNFCFAVFPLDGYIFLTWFGFYCVIVLILCHWVGSFGFCYGFFFTCNFIIMWKLCFDFWFVIMDV